MQFFSEKDIEKQESTSLKRAMRKYQKRIEEHEDKISNPKKYVQIGIATTNVKNKDWKSIGKRK